MPSPVLTFSLPGPTHFLSRPSLCFAVSYWAHSSAWQATASISAPGFSDRRRGFPHFYDRLTRASARSAMPIVRSSCTGAPSRNQRADVWVHLYAFEFVCVQRSLSC
jgi:hypothetical protein